MPTARQKIEAKTLVLSDHLNSLCISGLFVPTHPAPGAINGAVNRVRISFTPSLAPQRVRQYKAESEHNHWGSLQGPIHAGRGTEGRALKNGPGGPKSIAASDTNSLGVAPPLSSTSHL